MSFVTSLSPDQLLERHNPVLVLFPHEPERRTRPGAWRPGARGWGDYHPCTVEFFLEHAHLRTEAPDIDPSRALRSSGGWQPLEPQGADFIKSQLSSVEPPKTKRWELDVAEIPSQDRG